jgi:hypothetical protein
MACPSPDDAPVTGQGDPSVYTRPGRMASRRRVEMASRRPTASPMRLDADRLGRDRPEEVPDPSPA